MPEHDEQDLWLAERSAEIWASFARDGDPSVPGLVDWPQYSEDNNVYLDIGVPLEVRENVQGSYVRPNVENPRF